MFKKLKDKIAEEVKSSPQRIQQFAQAAQAAVTSASSSISDISNNDLFSIADDETPQNSPHRPPKGAAFQDVSLASTPSPARAPGETGDRLPALALPGPPGTRLRKLSSGSNASDVSFRLPSYESPGGMYHLQSDLDVSASEMEDSVSVPSQLEKVSKEHLFAAYRRSNEKYNKYRGRYTDLARHYRNLERENAKARAVLVETQDKALRRISELREQCSLEQSAKAHLESALRLELDEQNIKIESLKSKVKLLQSYSSQSMLEASLESHLKAESASLSQSAPSNGESANVDQQKPLITFGESQDDSKPLALEDLENKHSAEIERLNDKIQKLELFTSKCKETIKSLKEKSSQLTTELQISSTQLDKKKADIESLESKVANLEDISKELTQSRDQERKLRDELDSFESRKARDIAAIRQDLEHAESEVSGLVEKVDLLNKREEENVISLAENKLSVHKELESKENEIKILKDNIAMANSKIKANENTIENLKTEVKDLEDDRSKMSEQLANFDAAKDLIGNLEGKLHQLRLQMNETDTKCASLSENIKCTELQLKQEVSEKLAVIDRNNFLEGRNKQLGDENAKKNKQIADLEKEKMDSHKHDGEKDDLTARYRDLLEEKNSLKSEYEEVFSCKESLENELNIVNSKCRDVESKLEEMHVENSSLVSQLESLSTNLESLRIEKENIESSLESVILQNTTELESLKLEYSASEEEMCAKVKDLESRITDASGSTVSEDYIQNMETALKNEYEKKLTDFEQLKITCHNLSDEKTRCEGNILELEEKLSKYNQLKSGYEELVIEKDKCISNHIAESEILKKECAELRSDKSDLEEKITTLEQEHTREKARTDALVADIQLLQSEITSVQDSHSQIMSQKNQIEQKITVMEKSDSHRKSEADQLNNQHIAEIEDLKKKLQELHSEKDKLISDKFELTEKLNNLQKKIEGNKIKLKEYSENSEVWNIKLSNILDENNSLQEKCARFKQEKESVADKVNSLEQKINEFEVMKTKFEESKLETEFLSMRLSQIENDFSQASSDKNKYITEKESLQKELTRIANLRKSETDSLKDELSKVKADLKGLQEERAIVQTEKDKEYSEKSQLISKLQEHEEKIKTIEQLQIEKKNLESRLTEVQDKYRNVEDSTNEELMSLQETNNSLRNKCEKLELKCSEFDSLTQSFSTLESETERTNVKIKVLEQVEIEHKTMLDDFHVLKSEKSKLQADIEGLQAHLTKVSKDNSQLNDRIRELEASGEVMQVSYRQNLDSAPGGISDVPTMQLQIAKLTEANSQLFEDLKANESISSKLLDLERQNSILIEEKLELQDQINSSMDRHDRVSASGATNSDNDFELGRLRMQLRETINEKMDLEGRLADLELMSRSGDSNIKSLEQKNEKLKLTNDKLERRLDEALVSLNHIRTMEENTELEYLRNILYEYLTGPSNNNLVLAKVLAAVVKFDQRQTQLVLEREKEKQSVLGQLGLL